MEQLSEQHKGARLKLVGSCRNQEDEERVANLKLQCQELGLHQHVDFCLSVPYRELVELLGGAVAGLHTMTDKHFGISVVEYMAAGAVSIAHNSAGPKLDIVVKEGGESTGFLASTVAEFADAMCCILSMVDDERIHIAKAARLRASRLSGSTFDAAFKKAMCPLCTRFNNLELSR